MSHPGIVGPTWDYLLCFVAFTAVLGGLIFAIDDLWIDLYALFRRLKPTRLGPTDLERLNSRPQKKIAIIVANWREDEVLEHMVIGNLSRVEYRNYTFFLGVYPNDDETLEIANRLAARFEQVRVVVNSLPGPTTKGQMLNELARGILRTELETGTEYDLLLMQDSEDVLHPLALKIVNDAADGADFIQVPVFSFNVPIHKLVAGTYLDEFSEIHTKDLLVRERMGAAVPSAGVGTALSRRLVLTNMSQQNGNLLREDTLTEDYDLGLNAKRNGLKSRFVCTYRSAPDGKPDFIATREYFPGKLKTSVRQKTRWTLGIVFQGAKNLGWQGDWVDQYFMYRDRRGPVNALLILFAFLTFFAFFAYSALDAEMPSALLSPYFTVPAAMNFLNMVFRMIQRGRAVAWVNGLEYAFAVPLRWPVGNLVNALAAAHAFKAHLTALKTGVAPKWDKTAHVLPEGFGQTVGQPISQINPVVIEPSKASPALAEVEGMR